MRPLKALRVPKPSPPDLLGFEAMPARAALRKCQGLTKSQEMLDNCYKGFYSDAC